MSDSVTSHRSTLREFLASIATIQGDLSNITAPPFVLGQFSTVELPQYWADHPELFVAPALEKDEEKRALLVLKWFLGSLKNQQYAGRKEEDGVKKPLNAFLGELFIGGWQNSSIGTTRLVSEQVSHHPPVTACYLWNDRHGLRAEGFTQQEITFSGSVNIRQKGYAILHIDEYEEDYLIPVPNVKVKGILSGTPYPELVSNYSIVSSNGIVSEVKFEGKSLLGIGGGSKNGFEARIYRVRSPKEELYTVKGSWNGQFSIHNARSGHEFEQVDVSEQELLPITVASRSEQDPWESRRAWSGVIDALGKGDMKGTTDAKSEIEEGQRQLRRDEEARGEHWQPVYFRKQQNDPVFDSLSATTKDSFTVDPEGGIWKVDTSAIEGVKKPYHGDLLPTGQIINNEEAQTVNRTNDLGGRSAPEQHQQMHSEQVVAAQKPDELANNISQMKLDDQQQNAREESIRNKESDDIHVDSVTDSQLEAILRAKYQSAPR